MYAGLYRSTAVTLRLLRAEGFARKSVDAHTHTHTSSKQTEWTENEERRRTRERKNAV